MLIVRVVQHGNLLINSLSIKFSKFSPLSETTPKLSLLDKRVPGPLGSEKPLPNRKTQEYLNEREQDRVCDGVVGTATATVDVVSRDISLHR